MELLFLWIEDFRNIKKQGFDFSAEFIFEVISNKAQSKEIANYNLVIRKNEEYVSLFDGNIINVTGIVGMNGAGKSSLLHCLKMMSGSLSTLLSPLIFCLRNIQSGEINTYFYNGGGNSSMKILNVFIELDSSVQKLYNFSQPKAYTINRFGIAGENIKGLDFKFNEIATCFLSNTFDSHRENIYKGIYNISTNFILENWLKEYIIKKERDSQKKNNKKNAVIDLWPSHILQYHKSELKGLIKFLSYANTRNTQILTPIPKTLSIEFKFPDYEYLIELSKINPIYKLEDLELIQKVAIKIIRESQNKRRNFLYMLILTSFYHALRKDVLSSEVKLREEFLSLIDELKRNSIELFDGLRKILVSYTSSKDEIQKNKTIIEYLSKPFEEAVNRINFSENESSSDNLNYYLLKIDNNLWGVLNLIFELKTTNDAAYIDYSWYGGLSSGQEAFLIHFARLYSLKNQLGTRTIWLLIDEGDLYFHPEWQRKYFFELTSYIKILFPKNKIQLVITTHSPFIASDLPKQNLIFLKQNLDGMCQVSNNENHTETFGSNIHELFTQTFFLSDGLMGEFARTQIVELIKELDSFNYISQEQYENNFKNRINIIGESFIKAKLYELVARKSEDRVIDSIIDQRNNEIDRLKRLKNKRNNDKN